MPRAWLVQPAKPITFAGYPGVTKTVTTMATAEDPQATPGNNWGSEVVWQQKTSISEDKYHVFYSYGGYSNTEWSGNSQDMATVEGSNAWPRLVKSGGSAFRLWISSSAAASGLHFNSNSIGNFVNDKVLYESSTASLKNPAITTNECGEALAVFEDSTGVIRAIGMH